jgi:hypothetical protein
VSHVGLVLDITRLRRSTRESIEFLIYPKFHMLSFGYIARLHMTAGWRGDGEPLAGLTGTARRFQGESADSLRRRAADNFEDENGNDSKTKTGTKHRPRRSLRGKQPRRRLKSRRD